MNSDQWTVADDSGHGRPTPGTQVGLYRIEAALGEGGMGTVYRALDTKLNRPVAIKFLSDQLADAAARRRFQREAQMASSLNHPHILTVHDTGEFEGQQYLVTEFVDGGTLKDWIRAEKRTWRQIVELLTGVADGLAAAHGAGILHRDIKPANVLVAKNGYAKLADFGLAKLCEETPSSDDTRTLTEANTRPGVIVGTVAYMSPEQASGKPVDARSDIFSFGVLLYELLAGRRPFGGTTELEVLKTVIHGTAAPLTTDVPVALRMHVEKALEKDPAERYQSMRDMVVDLRRLAHRKTEEIVQPTALPRRSWAPWAAALSAVAVIGIVAAWWLLRSPTEPADPLTDAPPSKFTDFPGTENSAAISRDGKYVVFVSDRDGPLDLLVGQVETRRFVNITQGKFNVAPTPINRVTAFTSDGSEILITQGPLGQQFLASLLGGPVRPFLHPKEGVQDWSPDGSHLAYAFAEDGDAIFIAEPDGANPVKIFSSKPGEHNHFVHWSPDGRWLYFVHGIVDTDEWDLWRIAPSDRQPERLTEFNRYLGFPTPLDSQTVLYVGKDRDGSGPWLWRLDINTKSAHREYQGLERYTSIAASAPIANGSRRLVATVANPVAQLWSVPILDRPAEESDVKPRVVPSVRALAPRFGKESLFYLSSSGGNDGLWRFEDGQPQPVEIWKGSAGPLSEAPAISADGKKAAIVLRKNGKQRVHVIGADGTDLGPLTDAVDVRGSGSWSRDGKWIVIGGNDGTGRGLFMLPADGGAPVRLTMIPAFNPVWSPNDDLIVYSGEQVAGVSPLLAVRPDRTPVDLGAIQVRPPNQGERVRFLPNGNGLVYMAGSIGRLPDFALLDVSTKKSTPLTHFTNTAAVRAFDITSDGKYIVFDRQRDNSDLVLIDLPGEAQKR